MLLLLVLLLLVLLLGLQLLGGFCPRRRPVQLGWAQAGEPLRLQPDRGSAAREREPLTGSSHRPTNCIDGRASGMHASTQNCTNDRSRGLVTAK